MTEINPPPLAEAILESFGAGPEFRDAILGDLAQEHAQRNERFGARAARLWYYRQAVLAAPALLRNWIAGAKFADARRLLNVVGLAYATTMMIQAALFFGIHAIGRAYIGWSGATSSRGLEGVLGASLGLLAPVCAGYLAAKLEGAKPMVASIVLAFGWTGVTVLGWVIFAFTNPNVGVPVWVRLAPIPFVISACVIGGVLRVRRVSALPVAGVSSSPS